MNRVGRKSVLFTSDAFFELTSKQQNKKEDPKCRWKLSDSGNPHPTVCKKNAREGSSFVRCRVVPWATRNNNKHRNIYVALKQDELKNEKKNEGGKHTVSFFTKLGTIKPQGTIMPVTRVLRRWPEQLRLETRLRGNAACGDTVDCRCQDGAVISRNPMEKRRKGYLPFLASCHRKKKRKENTKKTITAKN